MVNGDRDKNRDEKLTYRIKGRLKVHRHSVRDIVESKISILNKFSRLLKEPGLNEAEYLLQSIIELASLDDILKAKDVRVWEEIVDEQGMSTGRFRIIYAEPRLEDYVWKKMKSIVLDVNKYDYSRALLDNGRDVIVVPNVLKLKEQDPVVDEIDQKSFSAFILENGKRMIISVGYDRPIPEFLVEPLEAMSKALCGFVRSMFKMDNLFEGVRELAVTDSMTLLKNRRALDELIGIDSDKPTQIWKEVIDKKKTIFMVHSDVDGFKEVNDKYGHLIGDEVIKKMGMIYRELIERWNEKSKNYINISIPGKIDYDIKVQFYAYRYGIGDEFCIVGVVDRKNFIDKFNNIENENDKRSIINLEKDIIKRIGYELAVEIRKKVREIPKYIKQEMNIDIGRLDISSGVSAYDGEEKVNHFIRSVDGRLYQAKKNKKDKLWDREDSLAIVVE